MAQTRIFYVTFFTVGYFELLLGSIDVQQQQVIFEFDRSTLNNHQLSEIPETILYLKLYSWKRKRKHPKQRKTKKNKEKQTKTNKNKENPIEIGICQIVLQTKLLSFPLFE